METNSFNTQFFANPSSDVDPGAVAGYCSSLLQGLWAAEILFFRNGCEISDTYERKSLVHLTAFVSI